VADIVGSDQLVDELEISLAEDFLENRRAVVVGLISPPSLGEFRRAENGESAGASASADLPISPHPSRPCSIANSAAEARLEATIFA
jgi:hypothetical protein